MFVVIDCIPNPVGSAPQKTVEQLVILLDKVVIVKHNNSDCYVRVFRDGKTSESYAISESEYNRIRDLMVECKEEIQPSVRLIRTEKEED